MGILTVLRNAFGRSRKGRDTDGETSREASTPTVPAQVHAPETEPKIPAPSSELQPEPAAAVPSPATEPTSSVADELVSAAFDNVTVTVPPARTPEREPTPEVEAPPVEAEAEPEVVAESEVVVEPEPEPKVVAAVETAVEPEPEVKVEAEAETLAPVDEPEAVAEAPVEPEGVAEPEAVVTPDAVVEPEAETPEPVVEAEPVAEVAEVAEATEPTEAAQVSEPKAEETPEPETAEPKAEEPAAAAEPEAADVSEPEPEEAAAAAEDTSESAAEDTSEPEAADASKPEAEETAAAAEPEAEEAAAVVAEPTVAEEPAPAPVAAAVAADEPTAADGDQAPQGPPAADDEPVTGGAGEEDTPAEGRVPTHGRENIPATLVTAYTEAATTLTAQKLTGTRAKVYLVLDRSASMRAYYKDGSAQALGEQALALAAHLDPEAKVHVVFFSTELDGTGELTLTDHENKVDELHAGLGRMGRTSYHAAVEEVLTHYQKSDTTDPALVVFQTDGAPDAKTPATQSLTDAAKSHPSVFFSFIAFGETDNKAFDYLRKLKTDNASFFHAGPTPRELTDAEIYEGVLANWRP